MPKDGPERKGLGMPAGGARRVPRHEEIRVLTPRQIYDHLDRYVIGQEGAKRAVATAAHQHLKRIEQRRSGAKTLLRKTNLLLMGPTGSGKTHIARNLAELLEVPFTVVDATEYTEAGYYGKDVEVMVAELLFKSGHSIDATERGIIFIDEIDKIARRSGSSRTGAGSRDIGGEGVQQSLLKLLEGREIFVPMNVTQHWNKHDFVVMDTQDVLFICAGTFSDLRLTEETKTVGFGVGGEAHKSQSRRATEKELLDYGLLAEFLGRLPVRVELDPLSEEDLFLVMTAPPDSVVREYQALLKMDGIDLQFSEDTLRAIARFCIRRRTGARSLRTFMEEICHDIMFDAPERKGETITIEPAFALERLERLADGAAGNDAGRG